MVYSAHLPLLDLLTEKIEHFQTEPVYGIYLMEHVPSLSILGARDLETDIRLGHRFFETANELDRGAWYFGLASRLG
jgi:hypothetical protein